MRGGIDGALADLELELPILCCGVMSEPLPIAEVGRAMLVETGVGVSMVQVKLMAVSIVRGW